MAYGQTFCIAIFDRGLAIDQRLSRNYRLGSNDLGPEVRGGRTWTYGLLVLVLFLEGMTSILTKYGAIFAVLVTTLEYQFFWIAALLQERFLLMPNLKEFNYDTGAASRLVDNFADMYLDNWKITRS